MVVGVVMPAVFVMYVIMLMTIQRQRPLRARAKEASVFRRIAHYLGCPLTSDMPIEANHTV